MSAQSHRILYGLRAINPRDPLRRLCTSAADEIERLLAMLEETTLRLESRSSLPPSDLEAVARSRELIGAST